MYLLITAILFLIFKDLKMTIVIPIAASIAYVLSPRFKEIETQSGTKHQVKWIFMKKTFLI
jgi:hypothetical protein